MKSFADALGLLSQQQTAAAPIKCTELQALAGPVYQGLVVAREPAPRSEFEAAALRRVLAVIGESSPALLQALQAVALPLEVRAEDCRIYLGYDTLGQSSRHYTQVVLGTGSDHNPGQIKMPGYGPYDANMPGEAKQAELYDKQAIAELSAWVPFVLRRHHFQRWVPAASAEGVEFIATEFSRLLAGPETGALEATAEKLGREPLRAMPTRLLLAQQAPPMPVGWVPADVPADLKHPATKPQYSCIPAETMLQNETYQQEVDRYHRGQVSTILYRAAQWPLAWADAVLQLHTAQQ